MEFLVSLFSQFSGFLYGPLKGSYHSTYALYGVKKNLCCFFALYINGAFSNTVTISHRQSCFPYISTIELFERVVVANIQQLSLDN